MAFLDYSVELFLMNWSTVLCFLVTFWYLAIYSTRRPKDFPPGPRGIPILGVAPFIGPRPEKTFTEWRKKYGDIMGFRIGNQHTVVLNSYDVIQEALVKRGEYFSHRPDNYIFRELLHKKGVTMNDYTNEYKIERKFAHTILSRLGFGKTAIEGPILDEADHLINQLGDEVELTDEAKEIILCATGSVLARVSLGKRYDDFKDPEFKNIVDGFHDFFKTGALAFFATLMSPWFRHIPPVSGGVKAIRNGLEKVCEIMLDRIEEHEKTIDEGNPRDFIDEYLIEMNQNGDPKRGLYSKHMLTCMVRDFFGAGMETVQGTLIFSFLVLANRPKMMKRVHDEIDAAVGEGRAHYALREKMPFCHAFMKEILRYRTIGPLCIPHCTSENIRFRGFNIPKGTTILPNLYSVHNDPEYWDKPEEFNPDRHIGEDGKINVSKYFMPFGMGPRLCIGRRLGEMEVFILFVTIFKNYAVVPIPTAKNERPHVVEDASYTGLTMNPPEDTPVKLVRRKKDKVQNI